MKPELKIKTAPKYRAEQYVTIRRPLHIEQRRPVSLAGIQVRQAMNTGLAIAKTAGSALVKASPFLATVYPNPLLYGMVIANGIDAFLHADGTAAKIEAFAMLGSGIQGASAQTIGYKNIGGNQIQATWGNGTASFDCNSRFAFRNEVSPQDGRYDYCDLVTGGTRSPRPSGSPDITLPISYSQIVHVDCPAAHGACNPPTTAPTTARTVTSPPTMPIPAELTPIPTPTPTSSSRANYSSVKPSNITFATPTPAVLAALPPDFTASKIGMALGLTGAGLLLATMAGGAVCYFLYLENKKNGTVRVQEISANKVAITMDRLKVPDEVRVKYEQVAIEQLPLIQAGEIA